MMSLNIINLIPAELRQQALDATVDFITNLGKKYLGDELLNKIKRLRSDSAFQEKFAVGLQQAIERFIREYGHQDEDLVEAITADQQFFKNQEIQNALLAILKKPGVYLEAKHELIFKSFDSVLPQRRNRERVNKAVAFFLQCLAEEVWMLPELRPIYEFQFQRMTAEAFQQQVALQKAQLQASLAISTDIRDALLQLSGAIAKQKALSASETRLFENTGFRPLHNLPRPDYERFVGRKPELEKIHELLAPQTRHFVVTIDGIGGIGKSALALEAADSYRRQYDELPEHERFEAIVWTTAKQTVLTGEGIMTRSQSLRTLEDIYTTIAVTLQREDIIRARSDEQDDLIRQALTQQRTLLIIDNLETVDDERVNAFIREIPAPAKVIVTTRHRIDVAYPVRLIALPEEDAQQLIEDTAKLKAVSLMPEESRQLFQRTGGVPLAIVWSIAQMGFGYGVESVLTRLGQPTGDIARFCFEAAVERIKYAPAGKLLLTLSLFADDASREALGVIADLPELDRDDGLVTLEKLSLVNKSGNRFSLLPLTKTFALAQLKTSPETENALRLAFIQYFQEFCQKFGGKQRLLYYNLDPELKNIQLVIEWAHHSKMWKEIGEIVTNIVEYLDRRSLRNELVEYSKLAIETGLEMNDKYLIARHKIYGLGWIRAGRLGHLEEGLLSIQEGKKLAQELGNSQEVAHALRRESSIYRKLKNYDRAKNSLRKSLELYQKLEDWEQEVRILGDFGSIEKDMGNLQKASEKYQEALERAREIGEVEQIALDLRRLSDIDWRMGNFERARLNAKESINIDENLNIIGGSALTRFLLARIEYALGRVDNAKALAQKAYEVYSKYRNEDILRQIRELLDTLNLSPNDPSEYLAKMGVQGYADTHRETQALFEDLKDE